MLAEGVTHGSETKDFISHYTAGSMAIMFATVPVPTPSPLPLPAPDEVQWEWCGVDLGQVCIQGGNPVLRNPQLFIVSFIEISFINHNRIQWLLVHLQSWNHHMLCLSFFSPMGTLDQKTAPWGQPGGWKSSWALISGRLHSPQFLCTWCMGLSSVILCSASLRTIANVHLEVSLHTLFLSSFTSWYTFLGVFPQSTLSLCTSGFDLSSSRPKCLGAGGRLVSEVHLLRVLRGLIFWQQRH